MKILNVITVIMIILFAWFFLSWVDVISDNNEHNPQHSDLNLFVILCEEDE
jgi:hypothetical protein